MQCETIHGSGNQCVLEQGHEGIHRLPKLKHTCHWAGCTVEVPPAMWGCKAHWFTLPKRLRDKVWATYRSGQEIHKNPSKAYMIVVGQVDEWIKTHKDEKHVNNT